MSVLGLISFQEPHSCAKAKGYLTIVRLLFGFDELLNFKPGFSLAYLQLPSSKGAFHSSLELNLLYVLMLLSLSGTTMLLHAFYGKGGPRPPLYFSKGGPF